MGDFISNPSYSGTKSRSQVLQHYKQRFILYPHYYTTNKSGNQNIRTYWMHERISHQKYLLKIIQASDEDQSELIEDKLLRKLAFFNDSLSNKHERQIINNKDKNSYIIPIYEYQIHKNLKYYHQQIYHIYMIFSMGNAHTLRDSISLKCLQNCEDQRIKYIQQQSILEGMYKLLEALRLLKFYHQIHGQINDQTVYLTKNGEFILSDPWMLPCQFQRQSQILQDKLIYYSPQKMSKMKNRNEKIDQYYSDVYSIGIVGIKALTLLKHHNKSNQKFKVSEQISKVSDPNLKELLYDLTGKLEKRKWLFQYGKNKQRQSFSNMSYRNHGSFFFSESPSDNCRKTNNIMPISTQRKQPNYDRNLPQKSPYTNFITHVTPKKNSPLEGPKNIRFAKSPKEQIYVQDLINDQPDIHINF